MQSDSLEEFSHMWDGSKPGWKLARFERTAWKVSFVFPAGGPTLSQVARLRELLDDLRDKPTAEVWRLLRGTPRYTLAIELGNLEGRWLKEHAEQQGIATELECIDYTGYLPITPDGSAMIIEDDELSRQVAQRMLAAGVELEITHED